MSYSLTGCHFGMVVHSKVTLPVCWCELVRRLLFFFSEELGS